MPDRVFKHPRFSRQKKIRFSQSPPEAPRVCYQPQMGLQGAAGPKQQSYAPPRRPGAAQWPRPEAPVICGMTVPVTVDMHASHARDTTTKKARLMHRTAVCRSWCVSITCIRRHASRWQMATLAHVARVCEPPRPQLAQHTCPGWT